MKRNVNLGSINITREQQKQTMSEFAKDNGIDPQEAISLFVDTDRDLIPSLGYIIDTPEDYREFLDEMYQFGLTEE